MKSSLWLARLRKNWMCLEILPHGGKKFESIDINPFVFQDKISKDFVINSFFEKGVNAFYYTAKHIFTGSVYYD